jgi:SAM-dependent methyltransferase
MRRFWDARAREDACFYVNTGFEGAAADDAAFWETGSRDLDYLLSSVDARIDPTDDLVEIGCGVGRMTRVLAELAASVVAIDISAEMLARARSLNPGLENVRWIVGDGSSLTGVDDRSVDACVSFVVFQHIPDPRITLAYVREIGRVLRPGGWAAIQVSSLPPEGSRAGGLRRRAGALRRLAARGWADHAAWRGAPVDLERLRETAGEAGMEVARIHGAGKQYCLVQVRKPGPAERT